MIINECERTSPYVCVCVYVSMCVQSTLSLDIIECGNGKVRQFLFKGEDRRIVDALAFDEVRTVHHFVIRHPLTHRFRCTGSNVQRFRHQICS